MWRPGVDLRQRCAVSGVATLAAALLYSLCFPPARLRMLAWIALVPLFVVLRRAGTRSALILSWAFTVAVAYLTGDWFPRAVATYYDQPAVVGVGFFLGVSSIMAAPYVMAFALCYRWLGCYRGCGHVLLTAAAWVASELSRARLLGGNPWVLLGYSQVGAEPLVQVADVTGVYGVSFVLAAVNAALAEVWLAARNGDRSMRPAVRGLAAAGMAAMLVAAHGAARLSAAATASQPFRVAVVQGNLDLGSQWQKDFYGRNLDVYLRLTQEVIGADAPVLVVWPENAMSFFVDSELLYQQAIGAVLGPAHVQLVAGGPRFVTEQSLRRYYNSAFLIASDGSVVARYDKQRLLPFAEYFPFASLTFLRRSFGKVREFTPGAPTPPLSTVAGQAGVVICNEALFPEIVSERVRSGADFLVNLSNDSWLNDAKFSAIVSDMVTVRAIEQRRYLVRASTAGPSTVVNPMGRITASAAFPSRSVITGIVRPGSGATLYARLGDTFAALCAAAVVGALFTRMMRGVGLQRPDASLGPGPGAMRTLRVYFIKPSQYDAEGLVLQYRWGVIPNNTLTVLAGLNEAYARTRPDVHLQSVLWDEMVDGVVSRAQMGAIRDCAAADCVEPIIALAGVQTGQYARARDLALQFKKLGFPVLIGGFHISSDGASRDFLSSLGITVVIGEAETTWPVLLDDYLSSRLQPRYAVTGGMRAKTGMEDIPVPVIDHAALPAIDSRYLSRFFNPTLSTIDTSRGCPFACSFCAVKNVMGRAMRPRDASAVVEWIRRAYDEHGVRSLFIVDDDFYRSPQWEGVMTGMAELRHGGRDVTFMMQVDVDAAADAHSMPEEARSRRHRRSARFVELAASAGCYAVFVGFESFNPANLEHTLKFQNQERRHRHLGAGELEEAAARVRAKYARTVDTWHNAGIAVHAGYMIGLPFDGRGSGKGAARELTEIGVDVVSFFPYTPLPGTEDYVRAVATDSIVDRDFNSWDCLHVVNKHPTLSPAEVYREYCEAHRAFYTWRRLAWSLATYHGVAGLRAPARYGMLMQQIYYTYAYRRGWHPMMGGIWRVRDETERRQVVWNRDAAAFYLGVDIAEPAAPGAPQALEPPLRLGRQQ